MAMAKEQSGVWMVADYDGDGGQAVLCGVWGEAAMSLCGWRMYVCVCVL